MTKLERLQAAARKRNGKPSRPGPGEDLDAAPLLRVRAAVVAFSMLRRGISAALVADRLRRLFGVRATAESVQRWYAQGAPIDRPIG